MQNTKKITYTLILIGALNWGLIGFLNFDLVAFLFGTMTPVSRIVYSLVGIAAILEITKGFYEYRHSHKHA